MNQDIEISLVIPFLNEEGSLATLYQRICETLDSLGRTFEIVFIDDGSTDSSFRIVDDICRKDPRVIVVQFPANRGKAAALNTGFEAARGKIVFTLDADLQDDPSEIPNFLQKLDEGYDLVSGWKKKRHDPLEKRIPSKLFNTVTSISTGLKLHDFNCGFKAYRSELLREVRIYGELHRYIPPLAHWLGYRVGEIPVRHHPREHGKSKYGWERYLRGFFDLFTVVLLTKFIRSPIYFFGSIGLVVLVFGLSVLGGLTLLQFAYDSIFGHRPLTYLAVLAILFGSQSISLGLLAELLTSISQRKGRNLVSVKLRSLHHQAARPHVSIVVPIHNERDNLLDLHKRLKSSLAQEPGSYEIVFVDDGSIDGSGAVLQEIYVRDEAVNVIQHRKRFGKASALQSGFDASRGSIIVTMDADLQDSPEDVTRFVARVEKGCDLVMGRRTGVPAARRFFSRMFNKLVSVLTPLKVHDINCGLKAFKRPIVEGVKLYGEFQRFFPVFVARKGVRIEELDVVHHERASGVSKYGISRIPRALLDMFAVVLLSGYLRRPLHLFGLIGVLIGLVGLVINVYLTGLKILTGTLGGHNTLLLMGVMMMVLGLQWFSTGILSELINNYFEEELQERK